MGKATDKLQKKSAKNEILIFNALLITIQMKKNKNNDFSYFAVIYNINSTYRL